MGDSGKADVNFKARFIKKEKDVELRIRNKLELSFMFSNLDDNEKNTVIGAMEEKKFVTGETIINQGDSGDELFILDSGSADCFKIYDDNPKYLKS